MELTYGVIFTISRLLLALLLGHTSSHAACPYISGRPGLGPDSGQGDFPFIEAGRKLLAYDDAATKAVDFAAVKADIIALLTDSQSFWPSDFGNYGPLFIRQVWHVQDLEVAGFGIRLPYPSDRSCFGSAAPPCIIASPAASVSFYARYTPCSQRTESNLETA
jgi:hypothetical protein